MSEPQIILPEILPEVSPVEENPKDVSTFAVTVRAKVYHAALLAVVQRMGSYEAVGKYLGVSGATVGNWVLLKSMPCLTGTHRVRAQRQWPDIERKLFELTGQTIEQLFPGFVRVSGILESEKTTEVTKEVTGANIRHLVESQRHQTPALEDRTMSMDDAREGIEKAMKKLTHREREVIKLRYGLDGNGPYTFDQVGRIFKITRERIRQIEANALRKLSRSDIRQCLEEAACTILDLHPCPACSTLQTSFTNCRDCDRVICRDCPKLPRCVACYNIKKDRQVKEKANVPDQRSTSQPPV